MKVPCTVLLRRASWWFHVLSLPTSIDVRGPEKLLSVLILQAAGSSDFAFVSGACFDVAVVIDARKKEILLVDNDLDVATGADCPLQVDVWNAEIVDAIARDGKQKTMERMPTDALKQHVADGGLIASTTDKIFTDETNEK